MLKINTKRAKPRPGKLAALGLVLVILLTLYLVFTSRAFLPLRTAAISQLRLVYRGHSLVRMKFFRQDGMTQIYIPAGEFTMGVKEANSNRHITHKVHLDAYWIDQVEVTNAMYARCLNAGECQPLAMDNPYFGNAKHADYPVVYVTWDKAQTYCHWVGGRLPTEAEWEKAARGTDGWRYPWGKARAGDTLLNFNGTHGEPKSSYDYLAGASPYGVLNMAGNVREWVADWFDADYYSTSPYENPQGPPEGTAKVLRGGAYWDDAKQVQTFYRLYHTPNSPGQNRGFRCVTPIDDLAIPTQTAR